MIIYLESGSRLRHVEQVEPGRVSIRRKGSVFKLFGGRTGSL